MADELTRWINKIKERRRHHEEMKDILEDYFESDINRDEDVARALNMEEEEIKRLRKEYEG